MSKGSTTSASDLYPKRFSVIQVRRLCGGHRCESFKHLGTPCLTRVCKSISRRLVRKRHSPKMSEQYIGATPRPLLGLCTLMASHIEWLDWNPPDGQVTLAVFLDLPSTEGTELHLKCRLYSNASPEVIQNPGLVAVGPRAALSPSGGPRSQGMLLFCVSCLQRTPWQASRTNPSCCSTQPTRSHARSLSACPRRQFLVCSLVVGFAIRPEAKSLAFYSEGGEVCGEVRLREKGTLLLRPEVKKNHFSTPFSVLCAIDTVILLQFLLRSYSLARSRHVR